MKPLPTLRQLRYLVALVDRCHFGKAAEVCLVSQSTLSAGIQELEDILGIPLLERTKRSVLPTPLGREIAERGRLLLKGAEELVDIARTAGNPMAGPLHLGVIPTIGPFLIPRVMPGLRAAFPGLKLFLREDQSERLLDRLVSGDLDAAVLALPYPVGDLEALDIIEVLGCLPSRPPAVIGVLGPAFGNRDRRIAAAGRRSLPARTRPVGLLAGRQ